MPSWLSGIVERSILQRAQLFNELAQRTMSDWGHVEERMGRVVEKELERLRSSPELLGNEDAAPFLAADAADEFYERAFPLAQLVTNLFAVGLFHLFEQQLADFVRIMNGTLDVPADMNGLLRCFAEGNPFKVDVRATYPMVPHLEQLQLVANVVKHAEGRSAHELYRIRPDLFQHPQARHKSAPEPARRPLMRQPLSGDSIYIRRHHYDEFARSVEEFWRQLQTDLDRTFA